MSGDANFSEPPMPANHTDIEKRLWETADELRANSRLRSSEYSVPVLGLIFLRYADHKFTQAEQDLTASLGPNSRRKVGKLDYQAQGILYLPEAARFSTLLKLPEGENIGKAINMISICTTIKLNRLCTMRAMAL